MDESTGEGDAELLDDGDETLEISFTFDGGDEAILNAIRMTSSTPC